MKGLYVLSSGILDKEKTLKFGMSECLENRIISYKNTFSDPYYLGCYQLNNDHNKSEIMSIESHILQLTINYKTKYFSSEYRQMDFNALHNIICDVLVNHKINYTYFRMPVFNEISHYTKKNIIGKITANRYANTFNVITKQLDNNENLNVLSDNTISNNIFKLRDYQIECIELIRNKENIIISIPTGTGKSSIIIFSLEENYNYLILVPKIFLMQQLHDEITKYLPTMENNIQMIGNKNNNFDINKKITICVFNSAHVVEKYCHTFKKIYIDEAHHIHKYNNCNDTEINDDLIGDDINKYTNIIKDLAKYNNNVYLSATINAKKGFHYYRKNIKYMIDCEYICDFNINVPIFTEDPDNTNICNYLIKNCKHIIVYCNSQREGKLINNILNSIQQGSSEYIDCYTPSDIKNKIIKNYKDGNILFLINVKLLVEGFDAPITRGVCFLHLSSSIINIIQIIGRALRLYLSKTIANIILPYSSTEDEQSIYEFLKIMEINKDNFKKTHNKKKPGDNNSIPNININRELIYNSNGILQKSTPIIIENKSNNIVQKNIKDEPEDKLNDIIQINMVNESNDIVKKNIEYELHNIIPKNMECFPLLKNEAYSGTHDKIAEIFHEMNRDILICAREKPNPLWYILDCGVWKCIEGTSTIRKMIKEQIIPLYEEQLQILLKKVDDLGNPNNQIEKDNINKNIKLVTKTLNNLETYGFIKSLLIQFQLYFKKDKFLEQLKNNKNNVIDGTNSVKLFFENCCIRGDKKDYITLKNLYNNYVSYSKNNRINKTISIKDFKEKVINEEKYLFMAKYQPMTDGKQVCIRSTFINIKLL